jgi:uncharacterized protein YjbJ (UPF0337 family)
MDRFSEHLRDLRFLFKKPHDKIRNPPPTLCETTLVFSFLKGAHMNQQVLNGKWQEIKGEMRKTWADLTDNEIEKTKGHFDSLVGLFRQKYGYKKEEATRTLNRFLDKYEREVRKNTKEAPSAR